MSHDKSHLSEQQQNAIMALLEGLPDREVADRVGVTRETVCRWRNQDPFFAAELNQRRQDVWAEATDRLRGLVGSAVETLEEAVNAGNVQAAVQVLRAVGIYGQVGAPDGPTDPKAHLYRQAAAEAQEKASTQENERDLLTDAILGNGAGELRRARFRELCDEWQLN